MAGATSKTSVKSTVTKKTAKTAAAKSSKTTKAAAKSTAAKSAPEKKAAVKKTTKSAPVAAKSKSAAAKPATKPASKPKTASNVKSKAVPASKSKAAPSAKTASKPVTAKKTDVKKTVKAEKPTKPAKADAVKKTSKPAKPVKAEVPVKTTKKAADVKTTSTKTPKVSKQSVAKPAVKKPEAPVVEPELEVKPKAKRATKFMTKGNAAIIAQLRQQLLQRRNEIISSFWGDLGSAYVVTQASGDSADAAMDAVHSEMRSQLAEKESQELTDIDYALHKMETGEYGLCEECGMPIPVERLEIKPAADLCVKCQELLEEDSEYDNYSYYNYD
ncbi:MAG: TraR/DksA C4-type zinc finger protein [Thermoguttaceae bacterium]|nr:TraR/DksA C4-type zinc finger protein [Thermoguttaceae bacterium]